MKSEGFIEILNDIAPLASQQEWDNSGYQIKLHKESYEKILVALEITNAVIDEAISIGVDMVLTHHPMLFNPLKSIDSQEVIASYIERLIKADIEVFSCHTPFDIAQDGLNDFFAERLGLLDVGKFEDEKNDFCRMGKLRTPMNVSEVAFLCEKALNFSRENFRIVNPLGDRTISLIGLCTGAGGEFIQDAAREGCQLYITGDVKHHEAQYARESGLIVIDCGHYGTEKIFPDNICELICMRTHGDDLELYKSVVDSNPFKVNTF